MSWDNVFIILFIIRNATVKDYGKIILENAYPGLQNLFVFTYVHKWCEIKVVRDGAQECLKY